VAHLHMGWADTQGGWVGRCCHHHRQAMTCVGQHQQQHCAGLWGMLQTGLCVTPGHKRSPLDCRWDVGPEDGVRPQASPAAGLVYPRLCHCPVSAIIQVPSASMSVFNTLSIIVLIYVSALLPWLLSAFCSFLPATVDQPADLQHYLSYSTEVCLALSCRGRCPACIGMQLGKDCASTSCFICNYLYFNLYCNHLYCNLYCICGTTGTADL
jgi:hypothetical protein